MTLVLITLVFFAAIMLAMSLGVMLTGRCLRGSCGGPEILDPEGESLACDTCPMRKIREAVARSSATPPA